MSALTYRKTIMAILSVGSVVLAGTIKDISSRNVNRSSVVEELSSIERRLASDSAAQRTYFSDVPLSESSKINGDWEIIRIVGSNEAVEFDRLNNPEDSRKSIKIKLELIGKGVVRIDGNNEHVYRVLSYANNGAISLVKNMGNGDEIIEAKKIHIAEKVAEFNVAQDEVQSLVLERALNQNKSADVLMGPDAMGDLELSQKMINRMSVSLTNTNGEIQSIDLSDVDLMEGGAFNTEVYGEKVSGVILNNGKEGYRVSFVTGPLAGAMLNFVSEEYQKEAEDRGAEGGAGGDSYEASVAAATAEAAETTTETPVVTEVPVLSNEEAYKQEEAQQEALMERKVSDEGLENGAEPVEVMNAEQIKETAETQGFGF